MARRRTRRRNPTPLQWTLIGVGVVAAGATGYGVYRLLQKRRTRYATLPPPPLPTEIPEGSEAGVQSCGPKYPGFVFNGTGCVPSDQTPGGIYVGEDCADFVFVRGDEGPQLDYLEHLVAASVATTSAPSATSADPTDLATKFLSRFWGDCPWPPPPHASTARILQLYNALTYILGREIVLAGGRVLGTNTKDAVDEQVAERLSEMSMPDFDPDVVPEIELPSLEDEPVIPTPIPWGPPPGLSI